MPNKTLEPRAITLEQAKEISEKGVNLFELSNNPKMTSDPKVFHTILSEVYSDEVETVLKGNFMEMIQLASACLEKTFEAKVEEEKN